MTEQRSFPETKEVKRRARELLGQKSVILKLIFAVAICWITNIIIDLTEGCVYYTAVHFGIIDPQSELHLILTVIFFEIVALLCVSAQVIGTVRLAWLLTIDRDTKLVEMFYYWRSFKRYFRSVFTLLTVAFLPKLFLYLLRWILFDTLPQIYLSDPGVVSAILYFFAFVGALIAAFGVGALLLLPYSAIFSACALSVRFCDESVVSCIRRSVRKTKGGLKRIFGFRFSFLPLILLSVATVGVLLLIYTVPYMLISYIYYNAALFEEEAFAAEMEVTFDER